MCCGVRACPLIRRNHGCPSAAFVSPCLWIYIPYFLKSLPQGSRYKAAPILDASRAQGTSLQWPPEADRRGPYTHTKPTIVTPSKGDTRGLFTHISILIRDLSLEVRVDRPCPRLRFEA
jgi:hypothetical protein